MSNVVKPAAMYGSIAAAVAAGSSVRPSRSMSAICHRPVTTRAMSRPGAIVTRGMLGGTVMALLRRQRGEARRHVDAAGPQPPHLAGVDGAPQGHHDQPH